MKKLAILGVGLMGGSLAKAVKRRFPDVLISGYARSVESYEKLKKLKFIDHVECELKAAVADADYVVLGIPIFAMERYMQAIAPFLKSGAVVFDLGSTKELIEKWAKKYLPKNVTFVGCHPLCGSEKAGAQNSVDNLYHGALCIITADEKSPKAREIKSFWEKLDSRVVFMPAKKHDRMLAAISHLPHLISFSLMNSVEEEYLRFAPPSLKDMTRIAASPVDVWSDIFLSNKKEMIKAVEKYRKFLGVMESAIRRGDRVALEKLISDAHKKRGGI